jgi:hypothetical protein
MNPDGLAVDLIVAAMAANMGGMIEPGTVAFSASTDRIRPLGAQVNSRTGS